MRMTDMCKMLCLSLLLLMTTSCATVFSGSRQWVTFESEPSGAEVTLDGQYIGTTPVEHKVRGDFEAITGDGPTVVVEKPGYEPRRDYLEGHVNGVSVLNLLILPFWAIDLASGAGVRYEKRVNYRLSPLRNSSTPTTTTPPLVVPPLGPSVTEDKYDRLIRLKELLDEGILTQEEFEKEKKKILDE